MGRLQSGYLEIGRCRIHHLWGGRGSPLLMIHGLGSAGYLEYRHALPELVRKHRVLAPDLPGFGRSEKPPVRYGIPLFTRTLRGYLDALKVERTTVVGTSLGGRLAMELALRYPRRISRVVLVNSFGLGLPGQLFYGLLALPGVGELILWMTKVGLGRISFPLFRGFAARLKLVGNVEQSLDSDYLTALSEIYADPGAAQAYLATVRALILHSLPSRLAELSRLKMPVDLIWGREDRLFPLIHAEQAHRLLTGSRLAVIEGAGHSPQNENPAEFNRALLSFLRG
ncbi:MAG: alpha/beta fold hydrolase [Candidatus Dormibacteraceae bacterium]